MDRWTITNRRTVSLPLNHFFFTVEPLRNVTYMLIYIYLILFSPILLEGWFSIWFHCSSDRRTEVFCPGDNMKIPKLFSYTEQSRKMSKRKRDPWLVILLTSFYFVDIFFHYIALSKCTNMCVYVLVVILCVYGPFTSFMRFYCK